MLIRALLFDFDGTLADTADLNWECYSLAFSEFGITINRRDYGQSIATRNWREFVPEILNEACVELSAELIADRKAWHYSRMSDHVKLNKSLLQLIMAQPTTMKTAIVTTASRRNVVNILRARGLENRFDLLVSGDDVRARKPHPDAYQKAAELLGVNSSECLVFEDSMVGIESANRFGAAVVQVAYEMQQWV